MGTYNPLARIVNKLKTNFTLDQTEGVFPDFKRRTFDQTALLCYDKVADAFMKKNKTVLLTSVSYPLQIAFYANQKEERLMLPFKFYQYVLNCKLRQGSLCLKPARIFSHHIHNNNPYQTWHQITMEFFVLDENENQKSQFVVYERREIDTEPYAWRICHIS